MTPEQRDDLIEAIAETLDDTNDVDVTFHKYARAVVAMFERDPDARAALRALLASVS